MKQAEFKRRRRQLMRMMGSNSIAILPAAAMKQRNNDVQYACKIISNFYKIAPKPDKIIFIDLPEYIAFSRKEDIQSIEYLKERRERYIYLSKKYNFLTVNGNKNPEKLLEDTFNLLSAES